MKSLALVSLLWLSFAAAGAAQPPQPPPVKAEQGDSATLTLVGEDGQTHALSRRDLKALPRESASITHEGKTSSFKGVLLAELLKGVGAPMGKDLRGPALSDVVIITARDGYVVVLALSDLEPSIRPAKVILADATADDVPLASDKDGPFRLVVDGDLKPARSVRNVMKIELRRLRPAH